MSTANEEISTEGEGADGAWYDARRERAVKKRSEMSGGKKGRGGAGSAEAITAGLLEIMEQSRLLRRQ